MTMTIDIPPQEEARLKEAVRRGQTVDDLFRAALKSLLGPEQENRPSWGAAAGMFKYPLVGEDTQACVTWTRRETDKEQTELGPWEGASARPLQEGWNNDKDAVYDRP